MHFSYFFQVKHIVRCVVEARKSGTPCFLCQSLLLSTVVLNDTNDSVTNAFQSVFWVKYIVRRVIEAHKIGTPCFLCRSSFY